jgi:uncharacterized protein YjbK
MPLKTSSREIELKRLLIGPAAADALIAALGPVAEHKQQVNHVFDTEDHRLRQHRHSVRLRFENGMPMLTAKGPSRSVDAHTSARTEAEASIDAPTARAILSGERDPIEVLRERATDAAFDELWAGLARARDGQALKHIGSFENLRRTVPVVIKPGLELVVEVDRTQLAPERIEHEVEIEIPDERHAAAVAEWLEQRAAAAGVELGPTSPKLARFYAAAQQGGHVSKPADVQLPLS